MEHIGQRNKNFMRQYFSPLHIFYTCLLSIASCSAPVPNYDLAGPYMPPEEQLRAGIVNKYYLHYQSEDGYERSTDIVYYRYEWLPSDRLLVTTYNPGFQEYTERELAIQGPQWMIQRNRAFWRGEEYETELIEPLFLDWEAPNAHYTTYTKYERNREYRELEQQAVTDTIVDERMAKKLSWSRRLTYERDGEDTTSYDATIHEVYAAGMGLWGKAYDFGNGIGQLVLVEQMSVAEFERRAVRAPKRVAYIDPDEVLDRYAYFSPCGDPDRIYDYYNGRVDAGFKGGKRSLERALEGKLDAGILFGESGYLTLRFVINCEGRVGWFKVEEADLNYQLTSFRRETIQHVFDVIQDLSPWQPGIINGEVADTYAYITLKLNNGNLVEILP